MAVRKEMPGAAAAQSTALSNSATQRGLPSTKLDIETDLDGVDGRLLRQRERHARDGAAGDAVSAEIEVEVVGLKRQPRVEGVFEPAARGPAVLLMADRGGSRQAERGRTG